LGNPRALTTAAMAFPIDRHRPHHGPRALRWIALALGALGCGVDRTAPDPIPTTGLYVEQIHSDASISTFVDIPFSVRTNRGGQYTSERTRTTERTQSTLTMRMDIAVPPNATAATRAPLLVFIHGGGFVTGDKSNFYEQMATYARAGYVVATINYRLTPSNQSSDTLRVTAVQDAVEDAQNAIRYLRVNAAAYGIDPTRVVTIGSSAGGAVSLVTGIEPDDARATSDFPGTSARVDGVISTGATLAGEDSAAVEALISFDATDSPVLLFHARETDSGTGATWTGSVLPTKARIDGSGNSCTVVEQPDQTHTVWLSIDTEYWPPIRSFLWTHLRLAALR